MLVGESRLSVCRSESGGGKPGIARRHPQTGVESRAFAENPLAKSAVIRAKAIAASTIGMRAASSMMVGEPMQPT
jgi:hypothetical protein